MPSNARSEPWELSWLAGTALILLLVLPPLRTGLESGMLGHMLVQLPLLIFGGSLIGMSLRTKFTFVLDRYDPYGIALILVAGFSLAFWMLPRSLDGALAEPTMEAAKFVTVPALIGIPLALAWPRLPAVARGFVVGNFLSMLVVLGWLYLAAPVRVCNYYLTSDQALTGKGLLLLAVTIALYWATRVFAGGVSDAAPSERRC